MTYNAGWKSTVLPQPHPPVARRAIRAKVARVVIRSPRRMRSMRCRHLVLPKHRAWHPAGEHRRAMRMCVSRSRTAHPRQHGRPPARPVTRARRARAATPRRLSRSFIRTVSWSGMQRRRSAVVSNVRIATTRKFSVRIVTARRAGRPRAARAPRTTMPNPSGCCAMARPPARAWSPAPPAIDNRIVCAVIHNLAPSV